MIIVELKKKEEIKDKKIKIFYFLINDCHFTSLSILVPSYFNYLQTFKPNSS